MCFLHQLYILFKCSVVHHLFLHSHSLSTDHTNKIMPAPPTVSSSTPSADTGKHTGKYGTLLVLESPVQHFLYDVGPGGEPVPPSDLSSGVFQQHYKFQ
jgi:hypothetical protein